MENKEYLILVINPGSTSTKIGLFKNEIPVLETTVRHSTKKLEEFPKIWDQYSFRKEEIISTIKKHGFDLKSLSAVVGRGGLLKPVPSGVYTIDEKMIQDARVGVQGQHASNLGCVLAYGIGWEYSIPAFIVDPPVVDEMESIARVSGLPQIERSSIFHALNILATARKFAQDQKKNLSDLNLVIAHMGGGITVAALKRGKAINVNSGLGEGPFTPERVGRLPLLALVDLCFSEKYTKEDLKKLLVGKGGLVAYFKTNSAIDMENMIKAGSEKFRMVYEAMAYQVSEEIGARATNLEGKIDAIILTGGIAYSDMLTKWIEQRVKFIAPVHRYPGENELQALALGGLRVLRGEESPKSYSISNKKIGIIYWSTLEQFTRSITIIEDTLSEHGYRARTSNSNLEILYKNCQEKEENAQEAIAYFEKSGVDLIFAIGSLAAIATKKYLKNLQIPIVFVGIYHSYVLGTLDLKENENFYAICHALEFKDQWQNTISKLQPDIKRLGLVYKADELHSDIQYDQIRKVTKENEIELFAFDLQKAEDISQALEYFLEAQVEWVVLGSTSVISDMSSENMEILTSRIPTLATLEKTVYKAGMFGYVTTWDEISERGAKIALQLFEGNQPKDHIHHPSRRIFIMNTKIAKTLGWEEKIREKIPESVMVKPTLHS